MGAFRLQGSDGRRVEVASKKAIGLIALLATGRDGERTRQFLQDKLWGSRESVQAQTSLRRELSNLRRLFADAAEPLLLAEGTRVGLNLRAIAFDIPIPGAANENDPSEPWGAAEFLEGLDLGVDKLDHLAGGHVDQVVVMGLGRFFVAGAAVPEVMPGNDPRILEQPDRAIDRRNGDTRIHGVGPAVQFLHVGMVLGIRKHPGDHPALVGHAHALGDAEVRDTVQAGVSST
jgi:hypothetical protein